MYERCCILTDETETRAGNDDDDVVVVVDGDVDDGDDDDDLERILLDLRERFKTSAGAVSPEVR